MVKNGISTVGPRTFKRIQMEFPFSSPGRHRRVTLQVQRIPPLQLTIQFVQLIRARPEVRPTPPCSISAATCRAVQLFYLRQPARLEMWAAITSATLRSRSWTSLYLRIGNSKSD